jgi:hypothetical protein
MKIQVGKLQSMSDQVKKKMIETLQVDSKKEQLNMKRIEGMPLQGSKIIATQRADIKRIEEVCEVWNFPEFSNRNIYTVTQLADKQKSLAGSDLEDLEGFHRKCKRKRHRLTSTIQSIRPAHILWLSI